ncbi:hypothetical protein L596_006097 [Steinernema carpocapsae]|uniref:Uncharacterized protein n=1 Tax=Steinernema carpocapsae TaxID=34508 RepID=A0A4U8V2M4_STECR|nr:hypothetical protein L596_006097 [Steinernema carpocapsae]
MKRPHSSKMVVASHGIETPGKISAICTLPTDTEKKVRFVAGTYEAAVNTIIVYAKEGANVETYQEYRRLDVPCDVRHITSISTSEVAVAFTDGFIRIYDVYADKGIQQIEEFQTSKNGAVNCLMYENERLYAGTEAGELIVHNFGTESKQGKELVKYMAAVMGMCRIDDSSVACGQLTGSVVVAERTAGPLPVNYTVSTTIGITSITAHPVHEGLIGFGTEDGNVGFYDTQSRTRSPLFSVSSGPVWHVAFDPQRENFFYSSTDDGKLLEWDASDVDPASLAVEGDRYRFISSSLQSQVSIRTLLSASSSVNCFDFAHGRFITGLDGCQINVIRIVPEENVVLKARNH